MSTDQTNTTATCLSDEQQARARSLGVARDTLRSTSGAFGGAHVSSFTVDDLLRVANYVVTGSTKVAEVVDAGVTDTQ